MPDPNELENDTALMLRVKAGDRESFARLVDRWQRPVMNFVFRTLPDETEAEDLTQAVFVQIWKTAARYEATARFSTFLFTIARNLSLNEVRRRSRHPVTSLDSAGSDDEINPYHHIEDSRQNSADETAQTEELYGKVQDAIDGLPEKQRMALLMCREGELSYDEIATVLEVSIPATKSLIHRARETLKNRLKPYLRTGEWTETEKV